MEICNLNTDLPEAKIFYFHKSLLKISNFKKEFNIYSPVRRELSTMDSTLIYRKKKYYFQNRSLKHVTSIKNEF